MSETAQPGENREEDELGITVLVSQFLLAVTTFPGEVPGMAELRGQTAPRMGFLSVKDTWQQIQLAI